MAEMSLAVAVLPAEGGDRERAVESIAAAQRAGAGGFHRIEILAGAGGTGAGGTPRAAIEAAALEAMRRGAHRLLAISAAETLAPDALQKLQPALRIYDTVWGGAALADPGGPPPKLERITRLAAQELPAFFHAALRWWIGPAHFVSPAAALEAVRSSDTSAWYADYMLNLWKRGNAYKTAQCLTHFHSPLPAIADADRVRLVASLEADPVFMSLRCGGRELRAPYTGLNPVIEREQMRGLFFEQEELYFLAERLPRGLRIVDVGANTGNHTLFFAAIMDAESVLAIEPLPRAMAAIRATVAENHLDNVDLSRLGIAVGAGRGMLRAGPPTTAGLGATHFMPDEAGGTPVAPLDELVAGGVDFIKIDAEGMEMQVLEGAAALIALQHPALFVEVVDETVGEFMTWVDRNGYRVERVFPDKTHCNYFLLPKD